MDADDLTPSDDTPDLDVPHLRRRVAARATERRHRNRRRAGFATAGLALAVLAGSIALSSVRDGGTDDRVALTPPTSSDSATTTSSEPTPSPPRSTPEATASPCPLDLSSPVAAADAGLAITVTVDRTGDPDERPTGTVHITNLGPGVVTIDTPIGGIDTVGLDADGTPVRDGDMRLRAANSTFVEEGESAEIPAFVHTKVCGPGGEPVSYVAAVLFQRVDTGEWGQVLAPER